MSAGLKNGWIRQADVGCFQSQNDIETTTNPVRHNMRTSATDIHTRTHKRLEHFSFRLLLENCSRAALTEENWRRLEIQGAFFFINWLYMSSPGDRKAHKTMKICWMSVVNICFPH